MIGTTLENYQITGLLGEGGMGIVYRAFDFKLERYAALKILNQQATKNSQFVERFKREAKNQAKLNHPNIVPVYGFTEQNNLLGIVMELVEGETLEKLIARKGKLEIKEALLILKQILAGVDYAHKKGFIHRDIKPSNIIISSEGAVKIMDFGISKSLNEFHGLTKTGTKIGTILYMSPEQIKAQEPIAQSDIYSIGITFYEMLVGVTPFDCNTEYAIMEAHLKKNPPRISGTKNDIPSEADKIINKATAKFLSKRYQNCEEFLKDVDELLISIDLNKEGKIKESKKVKKREDITSGSRSSIKEKLRFFVFAVLFLTIVVFLFMYLYNTVSVLWQNHNISRQYLRQTQKQDSYVKFNKVPLAVESSISSICFINDSIGIACGTDGTILRSSDAGTNWDIYKDTIYKNLSKIESVNNQIFITGGHGLLVLSSDFGKTWSQIQTGVNNSLFNIKFADNNTGFIIGSKGTLLKTTNGGTKWKQISVPSDKDLFGIFINESYSELYIVGWGGQFLKSSDLGNTWEINSTIGDNYKYLRSIDFTKDNKGFIVGGGGEIFKTVNGGKDWTKISTDVTSGLMKIYFVNNLKGYIVGNEGVVLFSDDSGDSWRSINKASAHLKDITANKPGKIFISGDNGTLLTY